MEKNDRILDVGCGYRPRGDVNLDIEERDVPNFVLGNVLELPFEDNSFATVYSSGLSTWGKDEDQLQKSWDEALRVATDQVVFEYNYTKQSKTWRTFHPKEAEKWLHEHVSPKIRVKYSQRGKMANIIRPFEKIFGTRATVWFLNTILRRSYYAKFKYVFGRNGLPETAIDRR